MSEKPNNNRTSRVTRRDFIKSTASAGLGVALTGSSLPKSVYSHQEETSGADILKIAFIGAGAQGRVLIESCLRIPGIRIVAVCDIWEYSQQYASGYLKKYGHIVNVYENYKDLLSKEKDLDAAIVASPDWMHAEHANACMDAGLHVYCEKEMSNSLVKARTMVQTAKRTGKLLQI